jgi:hypothetical protein
VRGIVKKIGNSFKQSISQNTYACLTVAFFLPPSSLLVRQKRRAAVAVISERQNTIVEWEQ